MESCSSLFFFQLFDSCIDSNSLSRAPLAPLPKVRAGGAVRQRPDQRGWDESNVVIEVVAKSAVDMTQQHASAPTRKLSLINELQNGAGSLLKSYITVFPPERLSVSSPVGCGYNF